MKNRSLIPKLLLPALVMLVFAVLLLAEMIGMTVEERGADTHREAGATIRLEAIRHHDSGG